jgi:hypothetical protein
MFPRFLQKIRVFISPRVTLVPWPVLILIILFSEMLKVSKIVSSKSKNIVKERK